MHTRIWNTLQKRKEFENYVCVYPGNFSQKLCVDEDRKVKYFWNNNVWVDLWNRKNLKLKTKQTAEKERKEDNDELENYLYIESV